MAEPIAEYGNEVGICGSPDGTTWEKLLTVDGKLQIDTESAANPTNLDIAISALRDAIAGASPDVSTLYTLSTLLTEIQARLGDETSPAAGSVNAQLAALLTELQAKLETADLNLDVEKDLQVDVKTMPTVTVQAAGGDKIFSFESIVEQALQNLDLAAGTNALTGTAVPAGKVWMITHAAADYVGTAPTDLRIVVTGLATSLYLKFEVDPVPGRWYMWSGNVYLQAGDAMSCTVTGATAGDDLYFRYAGVQMDAP